MNKRAYLFIFSLAILFYFPLAHAETPPTNDIIQNITGKFSTNFDQSIQLPSAIETLARIILGIKQSPSLTITLLVATACIWFFLFIILAEILQLTPFFNNTTRWIGAAVVTLLIAVTGTIETIALYIMSFALKFWFFEQWSVGALTFVVLLLIVGGFILSKFIRQARYYNEKVKAKMKGMEAGVNDAYVKKRRETEEEFSN